MREKRWGGGNWAPIASVSFYLIFKIKDLFGHLIKYF